MSATLSGINALNQLIIRLQMLVACNLTSEDFNIHRDEAAQLLHAIHLADDCAVCEIESNCYRTSADGKYWYDTGPEIDANKHAPEEIACMQQALDHLEARQMLARHTVVRDIVSISPAPSTDTTKTTASKQ